MYAASFLDHFQNPRGVGDLSRATHRGEAEDPACGDRLWLDLAVRDGVIEAARFRVRGCPGAIAVGSALVSLLPGRTAGPDAVGPREIEALLESIPPAKRHALRLGRNALRAALG